jgi:hypothetical protein
MKKLGCFKEKFNAILTFTKCCLCDCLYHLTLIYYITDNLTNQFVTKLITLLISHCTVRNYFFFYFIKYSLNQKMFQTEDLYINKSCILCTGYIIFTLEHL